MGPDDEDPTADPASDDQPQNAENLTPAEVGEAIGKAGNLIFGGGQTETPSGPGDSPSPASTDLVMDEPS